LKEIRDQIEKKTTQLQIPKFDDGRLGLQEMSTRC